MHVHAHERDSCIRCAFGIIAPKDHDFKVCGDNRSHMLRIFER